MTCVKCNRENCKYIDKNYECTREIIYIGKSCGCCNYDSNYNFPERNKSFWKRYKDSKLNKEYRKLSYGKELYISGRKFFIESTRKYTHVTDAITGYDCGNKEYVKNHIDMVIEKGFELEKTITPLLDLPIATLANGKVVYEKESNEL